MFCGAVFLFSGTAFGLNVSKNGFDEIEKAGIVLDEGALDLTKAKITNTIDGLVGPANFKKADENGNGAHTLNNAFMYVKPLTLAETTLPGTLVMKWNNVGVDEDNDRIDIEITMSNLTMSNKENSLSDIKYIQVLCNWNNKNSLRFQHDALDAEGNRVLYNREKDANGLMHSNDWGNSADFSVKITKTGTSTPAAGKYILGAYDIDASTGADTYSYGKYKESYDLTKGFNNVYMLADATPSINGSKITATTADDETYKSGFAATTEPNFSFQVSVPVYAGNTVLQRFGATVKATAHEGGSITDAGNTIVGWKMDKTYTFEGDDTHVVKNVKVDGVDLGPLGSYTFQAMTEDHSIEVEFEDAITVTFVNPDGTVLKTEKIPVGGNGTAPIDPTMPNKTFAGWDKPFTGLTENTTITAQYADIPVKVNYTIRTGDKDGGKLSFAKYDTIAGNYITPEGVSSVSLTDGWVLDGYYIDDKKYSEDDLAALTVDKDIDVEVRLFLDKIGNSNTDNPADPKNTVETPDGVDDRGQAIVTFVDEDGTVLNKQVVDLGDDAKAPTDPTQPNKTFTGWDKTFTNIQEDLTVTAQYKTPGNPDLAVSADPTAQPQNRQPTQQTPIQQAAAVASDMIAKTGDNVFAIVAIMITIGFVGIGIIRQFKE